MDVLKAMEADAGLDIAELRVDGGATVNELLMQFQSDILSVDVVRPKITETTALGAAYLAGLAVGYWKNVDDVQGQWQLDRRFAAAGSRASERQGQGLAARGERRQGLGRRRTSVSGDGFTR